MNLKNQEAAINELRLLAMGDRRSLLISGADGVGKTHLAHEYAKLLNCINFVSVEPKVADIREAIEASYGRVDKVVLCIENLDFGVIAASYVLLKFLEEPPPYIYVVVTCRNLQAIPDTIISRSAVVTVGAPTRDDLHIYASHTYADRYLDLETSPLWPCFKTFADIDTAIGLTAAQLKYIIELPDALMKTDSVATLMWKLQKFEDGSNVPVELVLRYIMCKDNLELRQIAYECLQELASGRVAAHASVAKFLFDYKYAI